jgi:hypothetical protein
VNDTIEAEVARYASAVRAAFADLPAAERELLLEDLEDHLQEVAAEAGGPLSERLGRPEAYAAELRASAGLPAPGAGTGTGAAGGRGRRRLRDSGAARRLAGLGAAVAGHPAGRAVAGFLPELRPAWWVLRGYLAVQAATVALSALVYDGGFSFPVPAPFGSELLGLLATAVAVVVSVRWARRGRGGGGRRALTTLGNAALALFGVILALQLGADEAAGDYYRPDQVLSYAGPISGLRSDGEEISNIFAFDADGKPLREVYLVDQDGDPVVVTHYDNEYLEPTIPVDGNGDEVPNRYPQVQHEADAAGSASRARRRSSGPRRARSARPDRRLPGGGLGRGDHREVPA